LEHPLNDPPVTVQRDTRTLLEDINTFIQKLADKERSLCPRCREILKESLRSDRTEGQVGTVITPANHSTSRLASSNLNGENSPCTLHRTQI
jgi:hypothetical protein